MARARRSRSAYVMRPAGRSPSTRKVNASAAGRSAACRRSTSRNDDGRSLTPPPACNVEPDLAPHVLRYRAAGLLASGVRRRSVRDRSSQRALLSEKRPFLLEGIEQFATPNRLIDTRRVVEPLAAARLMGKLSGTSVAALFAIDDLPASRHDALPRCGLLRVQRDVGARSKLYLAYTDEVDGPDSNYAAEVDGGVYTLTFRACSADPCAPAARVRPRSGGRFQPERTPLRVPAPAHRHPSGLPGRERLPATRRHPTRQRRPPFHTPARRPDAGRAGARISSSTVSGVTPTSRASGHSRRSCTSTTTSGCAAGAEPAVAARRVVRVRRAAVRRPRGCEG